MWADDGYGYLQDDGQIAAGQGAYYYVAMMNGRANQLTEMVPVDRIYSELGRYLKAGATSYLLLNTSDIRPVSMTTKAVMDLAWRGLGAGNAEEFYSQWSKAEFGEQAAVKVAVLYKRAARLRLPRRCSRSNRQRAAGGSSKTRDGSLPRGAAALGRIVESGSRS